MAGERLAVDAQEAARLLGVSLRTARTLLSSGQLPHVRLGRRVLISIRSLEQFLAERECGKGA